MSSDSITTPLTSRQKDTNMDKTGMSEKDIFSTVLVHCLLIIISPILTFFVFNFWIFSGLGLEAMTNNIYSAFAAVVVLHIALANFIYRAYHNTETIPGFDKLDKED
ncbi:unnamed protein product [Allacma fusca]|uniref:Vacuolar ATPase assembly integral membrane protein VMA21 homolog n=1 Tax=Allacma fusca TaxID=39272 RepID=A0A8J2PI66_9HEXA|nr:unnamed protein product [Allacma fusca]